MKNLINIQNINLKKGTLLFLLLTCLTYTTLAQINYTLQGSDVTIDGNGMITACSCTFKSNTGGTNLTIPKSVTKDSETITIKGIGNKFPGIFQDKNLVSVAFDSDSEVTTIGESAFRRFGDNKKITKLTLPTTLTTIGANAFANNSLTKLTLPTTLTTIVIFAFANNSLTTLTLPPSLESIGRSAFQNNQLTTLTIPNDAQLTTIGNEAFLNNEITKLSLPPLLETIGEKAFYNNSLTTLTFPENAQLTTIGLSAFQGNDGEDAGGNKIETLTLPPSLMAIGDSAFYNNSLTDVAFNNTNKSQIKSIGSYAFSGNTAKLNDDGITLPDHADGHDVTYKDSNNQVYNQRGVFKNFNSSLIPVIPPSYTLQEGDVTVDEQGIITGCKCTFVSKRIIIPVQIGDITITGIGDYAFSGKSLVAVAFAKESQVVSIGINAFWINPIATLTLPTTLTTIGEKAFAYNSLTTLTLPTTLTNIGYRAFLNNKNNSLTTLNIPEDSQLTTIGNEAFLNNEITKLSLPPLLETIGEKAFYNNSLTTVTFNVVDQKKSQIKNIGKDAFSENTKLTGITLPEHARKTDEHNVTYKDSDGKEYLPGESFSNFNRSLVTVLPAHPLTADDVEVENGIITKCTCNFLSNSIKIPEKIDGETITGIADKASPDGVFQDKSLVAVAFAAESKITSIGSYAFSKNQIATLTLPTTVTTIGWAAFYNNDIKELSLPTTLTTIEKSAFGSNQITTLTLPTTLTTIGEWAFQGQKNNSLTSVTFAGDQNNKSMIQSIGINAFSGNTGLMSITLPPNGNNNFDGYRDSNGVGHIEGATITDFKLGYNAFIPYTLTAKDIIVKNEIITQCVCNNFTSRDISIPASITKDGNAVNIVGIGTLVFSNKQLTSVVLPEGLISIGVLAFGYNSLAPLTLPSSVKYIGSQAFYGNNLTAVTFAGDEANIISIGHEAFANNTVTSINLPSHTLATDDDFRYKDSAGTEYAQGAEFKDFDRSLYADIPYILTADDIMVDANGMITECNCDNFDSRTITIPTAITTPNGQLTITGIGNNVFQNETLATVSFAIGSQITAIGRFAFNSNSIGTLTLPTTLTTIGEGAFLYNSITTLTLPPSLTIIGISAFKYNSITKLTLPTTLTTIGASAFQNNPLPSFILPSVTIEGYRTYWQDGDSKNLIADPTIRNTDFTKSFELVSIEQFTLTVEVNNEAGGSIEPSDDHFVIDKADPPSTQELTATPNEGWRFDKWVITSGEDGNGNPITETVDDVVEVTADADKTATAYFVEQVTLTLAIHGVGQVQGLEAGENPIDKGQEFTITATPNEGHEFEKWVFEGANISTSTYTIPADKTQDILSIEVHFEEKPFNDPVELTINIDGQGTVTPNTGINTYERGSGVDLTATPDEGWRFDKWVISDEENKTDKTTTITLDANKAATAHFVQQFTLTTAVAEQQGGTIAPLIDPNGKVYDINTKVELTATPNDGWRFDRWVISDEENETDKTTTITLDKNKTATAYFVEQVTLTLIIDETGASGEVNGLSAGDNKIDKGVDFELKATPASGQKFVSWTIDGKTIVTEEYTLPATDTETDIIITVTFKAIPLEEQVTLTLDIVGEGSTTPDKGESIYEKDYSVELTATPNDGWRFDKWVISDEENKTDKTTTITLDKNKSVTAHFVKEEEAITSILTEVVSATPYPNPVTSQITLKAKDGDLIQLFSPKGKQQYSTQHTGNEVHTIDVSTLPVGVYLVRITDAEGNTTTKRILKK